ESLKFYKERDIEQQGMKGGLLEKNIDLLGRNFAVSVLAGKGKIMITQTISFMNGAFEMPRLSPVNFVKHYSPTNIVSTMKFLVKN
ncbi:hypothetical protein, partial [Saccharophagus degradans]